ncbi:MAG: hypothetical protein KAS53_07855 [Candidatus Cloacimonetes bacterium]|nr:hypothetical protein [Candidatus Cloacimonadota bacterium]
MKKMILPILLILFLIGCSIPDLDNIGLPSWTVPIRLVILNDTFDAEIIATEVGSFQASGDTLQFYEIISESQYFGDIEIDDTDVHSTTYTLGEVAPSEVALLNGQPVNVLPNYPNYTIPFEIAKEFEPFDEYEQIKFVSGNLNLTITNNTVFWFGNAPDGLPLTVQVLDDNEILQVEEVIFENVAPLGGSVTGIISLADSLIGNNITINLIGEGDITDNSTATIDTSATVQMDIQITDIQAEYVINALIPSQPIEIIEGYQDIDLVQPEIVDEDSFMFNGNSSIIFTIESQIPMVTTFELIAIRDTTEMSLTNYEGEPINLNVGEGTTQIEFTSDEYNINEILQIIPDGFEYSMDPFIGDGTIIPYLSFDDSVSIDFEVIADIQILTYEEDGIWIIPLDDGEFSIETQDTEDFDDTMQDAYNSGKIIFKYWNNTGMEVGFDFLISDDSTNIVTEIYNFEEPDTTIVQVFRVPLFEETSGDNYKQFELDVLQRELDYFVNDSIYTIPRVHIFSEGEVPWTGGLRIQADLVIEIDISNDLVE